MSILGKCPLLPLSWLLVFAITGVLSSPLGTQLVRNGFGRSQQPTTGAQWYGLVFASFSLFFFFFFGQNEHHHLEYQSLDVSGEPTRRRLRGPRSQVSFRRRQCALPPRASPFALETMQGLRKPNSSGMREDPGSRFFQVRSVKLEMACPNT